MLDALSAPDNGGAFTALTRLGTALYLASADDLLHTRSAILSLKALPASPRAAASTDFENSRLCSSCLKCNAFAIRAKTLLQRLCCDISNPAGS